MIHYVEFQFLGKIITIIHLFVAVDADSWIGLYNPESVKCADASTCDGQLFWSDGTQFTLSSVSNITNESD